eukprot:2950771-Rhodomonas_salina.1
MRCPGPTWRMPLVLRACYAMSGTDMVYRATRCPVLTWCIVLRDVRYWLAHAAARCPAPDVHHPLHRGKSTIALRTCYAMFGTDPAYRSALSAYARAVRCQVLTSRIVLRYVLRDVRYRAGVWYYAMSGTDLASGSQLMYPWAWVLVDGECPPYCPTYALCDVRYCPTHALCDVRYCPARVPGPVLRAGYGISGTVLRTRYATPLSADPRAMRCPVLTPLPAYARATRCPVLSGRMVRTGAHAVTSDVAALIYAILDFISQ